MAESERQDSPEQAEFRRHCREWLQDNAPPDTPVRLPISPLEIMTEDQLHYLQDWQKAAYDAGLVGCDYPVDCGGGGLKDCQRIANAEMLAAKTPFFPNVIGLARRHGPRRGASPRLIAAGSWCR